MDATLQGSADVCCFRIDDHVSTGSGLLAYEQDTRAIAALAISDDEARRLVQDHFPELEEKELQYGLLSDQEMNHQRLHALVRDLLSDFKTMTYLYNRRYLLLLTFVDYAIAPFYRARGMDIYANGENTAMASLLCMSGSELLGRPAFDDLLVAFQRALQQKTPNALSALVAASRATEWHRLPEALGPLAQFAAPECLDAIRDPQVRIDPTRMVLQVLLDQLESLAEGPYRIELGQARRTQPHFEILQNFLEQRPRSERHARSLSQDGKAARLANVRRVDAEVSCAHKLLGVLIHAAMDAAAASAKPNASGQNTSAMIELFDRDTLMQLTPGFTSATGVPVREITGPASSFLSSSPR